MLREPSEALLHNAALWNEMREPGKGNNNCNWEQGAVPASGSLALLPHCGLKRSCGSAWTLSP